MKYVIFTLTVLLFSATSCNKKGCTDPTALNYNSEATKDDGSCEASPTVQELLIGVWDRTSSETIINGVSLGIDPDTENYTYEYTQLEMIFTHQFGIQDTSTYVWNGDTQIVVNGTTTFDLLELTSTSLILSFPSSSQVEDRFYYTRL